MNLTKYTGLTIFCVALAAFIGLLFLTRHELEEVQIQHITDELKPQHQPYLQAELEKLAGQDLGGKFSFVPKVMQAIHQANAAITTEFQISEEQVAQFVQTAQTASDAGFAMTETSRASALEKLPESMRQTISDYTGWLVGKEFGSQDEYQTQAAQGVKNAVDGFINGKLIAGEKKDYAYKILKGSSKGLFWEHQYLFFWLIIVGGSLGALMWIVPAFFDGIPGIKHNGIYHNSATSRGAIGIATGVFLISFYILLYFFHYLIPEWISLVDPVSMWLRGEPASQWFMYGFLYTIAITVMGIRMFTKYRHSNYHLLRTASVMFFQICFAFLIPQVLYQLNLPEDDLKNIWPLDYDLFFEWNIDAHIQAGSIGIFMLVWGIILTVVGVPLLTYFFGKRWYCSWVCGCGGLAETLGDPYRQLSDKSLKAWKVERWLIHSVLVFAVIMTGLVLYTYFSKESTVLGLNSYTVRSWYGFGISSIFAGVVGTGFYPLMGSRVWCRFGCPLAAYLGIVQRFKSRFRITTNGGQCISCGNCSTYCEMGIDVRAYAQRGQNIVRASCVGCGVCAAVCPRGVLALENGPNTDESRMSDHSY
ncbi:4Fe-4S dicluster domain-containing protein [Pontibacter sp. G13]|uniref:4Fe-4S binding protein n=1 Tax=Pontibacter sp. G13 TaxID=3074898 RepID=UPI002889459A|nr:4Fe-4S dicluster domain-containing protein [Pontibacter sp. G13]WNJ21427.1 4Fe-4S binding protein [Pontibacter sp. G13]